MQICCEWLVSVLGVDRIHHRLGCLHPGKIFQDRASVRIPEILFQMDDQSWYHSRLEQRIHVGNMRNVDEPSQKRKMFEILFLVSRQRCDDFFSGIDGHPIFPSVDHFLLRIRKHTGRDQTPSGRSITTPWLRHRGPGKQEQRRSDPATHPDEDRQDVDNSHGRIHCVLLAEPDLLRSDYVPGEKSNVLRDINKIE